MGPRAAKVLTLVAWAAPQACGPRPGAETSSDLLRPSLGVPATAALVVGCWRLEWAMDTAVRRTVGEVPDSIRLRDEVVFGTRERLLSPATQPTGRSAAGVGPTPWEARYVVNRWWIEDSALRLRFWNGERDEWDATLEADSNELVGVARLKVDPKPPGDPLQAGLTGSRIDCDL